MGRHLTIRNQLIRIFTPPNPKNTSDETFYANNNDRHFCAVSYLPRIFQEKFEKPARHRSVSGCVFRIGLGRLLLRFFAINALKLILHLGSLKHQIMQIGILYKRFEQVASGAKHRQFYIIGRMVHRNPAD